MAICKFKLGPIPIANGNFVACLHFQTPWVPSSLLVRTSTCTCPTLNPLFMYIHKGLRSC